MITVESIVLGMIVALVAALGCGLLARFRGASAAAYGGLGLFLGLGAVPLTLVATARFIGSDTPESGPGFTPADPHCAASPLAADPEASADLVAWSDLHRSIQQGLCLGLVLILSGTVGVVIWVCDGVFPTLVTLFEGMSLKLPAPTQMLVSFCKFFRSPVPGGLWWVAKLACPAAFYVWMLRGGYGLPLLGKVWRHTDRLCQLYAMQAAGEEWLGQIPVEVARRLQRAPEQEGPAPGYSFEPWIRRERDRLASSLWMLVPLLCLGVGVAALFMGLLGLSIFLPVYQLIGNVS